jgi:hypothetical protein
MSNTTITVSQSQLQAIVAAAVGSALAQLTAPAPKARAPRKATSKVTQPKAAPKPAPKARATKGAQSRETLSRKDWNKTLSTKARFLGGDSYKRVMGAWVDVQAMRAQGMTPDEVLAQLAA